MDFTYLIFEPGIVVKTYMTPVDLSEYLDRLTKSGFTYIHVDKANVIFVGTDEWILNSLDLNSSDFERRD